MVPLCAQLSVPETDPISVERLIAFEGLVALDRLVWIGAGLLGVLALLALRDALSAKRKWMVPLLFTLRALACVGVLLALAGPTAMTRKTFEESRGLGIYLDTSASMSLQDPADGEGHLMRWRLATTDGGNDSSALLAIDAAIGRIDASLALITAAGQRDRETSAALTLLAEQIKIAVDVLKANEQVLAYPALAEEVRAALQGISDLQLATLQKQLSGTNPDAVSSGDVSQSIEQLRLELGEWQKRLVVIAREMARRDEAASGALRSEDALPSRIDQAKSLLLRAEADALSERSGRLEVLRSGFSEGIRESDQYWRIAADLLPEESELVEQDSAASVGPRTNLNAALAEIARQYRDGRIDSAVLVTDGVHNNPGTPLEVPPILKDFPLMVVPSGGDYQIDDIALWQAVAPETLMRGDFLAVDCLIGSRGYDERSTQVRLLDDQGRELDSVQVIFGSDGRDQRVRLTTAVSEAGFRRFEVVVEPLEGELQTNNNRQPITVDVFSGDLKVLLADGWPRWETRYLSNLLKRDSTTEHQEILFAPDPPDPMPATFSLIEELKKFNIVILGDIGVDFLGFGQLGVIEDYVSGGGNLIVIAGRDHMPADYVSSELATLLPVRLDETRPSGAGQSWQLQPTAAGLRIAALSLEDNNEQNRAVWQLGSRRLPLTEYSPFNLPKPAAQVIVEALPMGGENHADEQAPLPYIVWHRYGAGRVFYLPSPTTYFLRYRYGDRYHYRFWGQFLRWVTMAEMRGGNARVQIATEARHYRESDQPQVEVDLYDPEGLPISRAEVQVQLERDGAEFGRYPLAEVAGSEGKYSVTLPALGRGDYRVRATGATVETLMSEIDANPSETGAGAQTDRHHSDANESGFLVIANPGSETGNRTCDWETVHRLAAATAGAVVSPDALRAALDVLTSDQTRSYREEVTRIPMWDRWPLFFFILIFLCFEWAGRKYAGLI